MELWQSFCLVPELGNGCRVGKVRNLPEIPGQDFIDPGQGFIASGPRQVKAPIAGQGSALTQVKTLLPQVQGKAKLRLPASDQL